MAGWFSRTVCFFVLSLLCFCLTAGCLNTYDKEFKKVDGLVQSATARLDVLKGIDPAKPSTINVMAVRSSAAAAKTDLTEALRVLEQDIPPDAMVAGQVNLDATKTMIRVYIEYCDMIGGPMADALEHSVEITNLKDPVAARAGANVILADYQEMKAKLVHMNQMLATIDVNVLSPEVKGTVVQLTAVFKSMEQEVDKAIAQLQGIR
jgi:hypothetical protein